ncbi:MAG TPA: galactose oxidase-like domain-containing protein [Phycisphaerae bacterium]|nr:galactose oxidase-like domain-containing protein [Phycisphaerae bacterium]
MIRPGAQFSPSMSIYVLTGLVAVTAPVRGNEVTGEVRNSATQAPIPNARVILFEPTLTFFKETRSDALGQFTFANLPVVDIWRLGACSLSREYIEIEAVVKGGTFAHTFLLGPESHPGQWTVIGNTLPEFFDATDIAILRPDGKIFYCHDTVDPVLFDPVSGVKTFPVGSWSSQGCMSSSLLADGRIMMIGGQDGDDPGSFTNAVRWVKAYNSLTDSWDDPPDLQHPTGRWYPGLARLADGSFLVMGGGTCCSAVRTETCERMDLSTLTWSYTGSMLNPCEFPPSALLHTGEVLATWSPPQLYNPVSGQWRATGNFNQPTRGWPGHSDHSLVMMADGRALVIGILRPNGTTNSTMGEIYNPSTETWSLTSNSGLVRFQTEVVQLPDGRVLAAGGETQANPPPDPSVLGIVKWSDLYDPPSNTWRRVADMNWFREYHAVTLLVPDGRVVMTGGTHIKFQFGPTSADIEAFSPPYLFRGVRPQITQISTTQPRLGQTIALDIFPTMSLTGVVLMGCGAHTHWVDGGVPRRLELPVQQSSLEACVTLPMNANALPAGHYMLFAMVDDIPSVAKIIRVDSQTVIPGDFDGSGRVDTADIAPFVAVLLDPDAGCAEISMADLSMNGVADGADLQPFVTRLLAL